MYCLINNSTLPNSLQYVSNAQLSSFSFNEEVMLKIINALNINKAHGHDDNQLGWLNYAVNMLSNPCLSFSRTALILVHFQISGRDQTYYLFIKKMIRKLLITSDQFPICLFLGKLWRKLLFNSKMDSLEENSLLNSN